MKANKLFFAASVAIATAAVSCQQVETINDNLITKIFTASMETAKTAIDFDKEGVGTVTWETGDCLWFRYDSNPVTGEKVATSTTGESGTFELTFADNVQNIYAIRMGGPDLERITWYNSNAGKLTINLPEEWSADKWTFDNVNCIAGTAKVDETSLSLSPVLGLLKLNVTDTNIEKFVVKSSYDDAFGSHYAYTIASKTLEKKSDLWTRYDNVVFHTGGNAGTYYIPVIPGLTATFTIEAFTAAGESLGACTTPSVTTAAGKIYNLGAIESHLVTGDPAAEFKTAADEIICAFGYTKKVEFAAAGAWTASIKEGDTAATIDVTSGAAGDASINVTFAQNSTSSRKPVTVVIKSEGFADAKLVFTQERKADYEVVFRKYPDSVYSKLDQYRNWTTANTLFIENSDGKFGTFTLTNGGIKIIFSRYATDNTGTRANCGYNEVGFLFGGDNGTPNYQHRGGYIRMPAIKGKKLVKIELFTGANTENSIVSARVANTDGAIVINEKKSGVNSNSKKGTEENITSVSSTIPSIQYELTTDHDTSYLVFNLTDSTVNTNYDLQFATRSVIRWFTLYYE